ncbi:chorismate-binding protein [Leucobacter sp. M11]|uniref:chorismate-binding protein n=1 Tax=Leucobacter sp. M11 TaxID=2993565 RepID=UPI002D7F26AC|nr:chorismate-binding protein [Leucobacter sp. M11]MEB4616262.1 chorismate-binding protein [Leucobacter sp. M11]
MSAQVATTTTREAFDVAYAAQPVTSVCRVIFADGETPVSIYRRLADSRPGTFLLESAGQGGVFTRFSFVGAGSFGVLGERDGEATWAAQGLDAERLLPGGLAGLAPLDALSRITARWASEPVAGLPALTSGFVGYVGWEAIRQLEHLPNGPAAGADLPGQALSFVSELVVIDHREGAVVLLANVLGGDTGDTPDADLAWTDAQLRLDALQEQLAAPMSMPLSTLDFSVTAEPESLTRQEDYLAGVRRAQQYIVDGDIFQVVLSQRFDHECRAEPLDVYRVLRHLNPSPYLYLLSVTGNDGVPFHVVGSSPEALITVTDDRVYTHPIAGSRPRGATVETDAQHERDLLADEKERAEHLMLVDLSRNDLLRVCEPDSVEVTEFMRIERFSHIMHIVSSVEGRLRPGQNAIDAFRATFPAGTLSGAPKPRALQIIDELEPIQRGVYGGVVGYFGLGGSADLAIAIRTATIRDGVARVQAGGGIVHESNPLSEFEECRSKAAAPLRAVAVANTLAPLPAGGAR